MSWRRSLKLVLLWVVLLAGWAHSDDSKPIVTKNNAADPTAEEITESVLTTPKSKDAAEEIVETTLTTPTSEDATERVMAAGRAVDAPEGKAAEGDVAKEPVTEKPTATQEKDPAPKGNSTDETSVMKKPGGGPHPSEGKDCPLMEVGDHPWLIRITPMTELLNHGKTENEKHANPNSPVIDYESLSDTDDNETETKMNYRELKSDGTTKMHGSLISPSYVLTTAAYRDFWMDKTPFPENYLSLIGYSANKNCYQEQWGDKVIYHNRSSEFSPSVVDFAIIVPKRSFEIQGNPFLFGKTVDPPDFQKIASIYKELAEKKSAEVRICSFKNKENISSSDSFEPSSITFMSWEKCKDIAEVKKIQGIDPHTGSDSFFCANTHTSWPHPEEGNLGQGKLGVDWFQGSPVVYVDEKSQPNPIGFYVYSVGPTGHPHIFATFTQRLREILNPASAVLDYPDEEWNKVGTTPSQNKSAEREVDGGNHKTNGCSRCHFADFWIVVPVLSRLFSMK